jgi:hypothetical protein
MNVRVKPEDQIELGIANLLARTDAAIAEEAAANPADVQVLLSLDPPTIESLAAIEKIVRFLQKDEPPRAFASKEGPPLLTVRILSRSEREAVKPITPAANIENSVGNEQKPETSSLMDNLRRLALLELEEAPKEPIKITSPPEAEPRSLRVLSVAAAEHLLRISLPEDVAERIHVVPATAVDFIDFMNHSFFDEEGIIVLPKEHMSLATNLLNPKGDVKSISFDDPRRQIILTVADKTEDIWNALRTGDLETHHDKLPVAVWTAAIAAPEA